ncbi:TPA_asm: hypothetical protein [Porphyromonas phage phage030a_KCOM2803]|uniref:Uncharacterized protein n=2 Tax=Nixviridae TaxID=3424665 RepID=A0AAT9JN42_9CAUD
MRKGSRYGHSEKQGYKKSATFIQKQCRWHRHCKHRIFFGIPQYDIIFVRSRKRSFY